LYLREDGELLAEEVVREIHSGVHHSHPVCADGGGDGLDVNGVEMLRVLVRTALEKRLLVQVVVVSGHKEVDFAHDLEDVQPLSNEPMGEMVKC
jgi:hypothetical protein